LHRRGNDRILFLQSPMNPSPSPGNTAHGSSSAFPTTHWSIVLDARAGSESQARAALAALCRQYWYPIYSFIRRHGRAHHEAEDCTQAFFARLLANEGMTHARPERGRFRSFLLTALRHLLANDWRDAQTAKRGGGVAPLPLEVEDAEERFTREPTDPGLTPEQVFDRNWALAMIGQVVEEMRSEYVARGRAAVFDAINPLLLGDPGADSLVEPAAQLGMSRNALATVLHRLRRRLGEGLRAAVADTVADPADVDAELRHLIAAIR
jgi:RNA polymerase sigma factor (sigma-70 family)